MTRRSSLKVLLEAAADAPAGAGEADVMEAPSTRTPTTPPPLAPPRSSGAVRAMGLELSRLVDAGARILEIDPADIAPSGLRDRLDEGDESALASLAASIAANGQHVPILVRDERAALAGANSTGANGEGRARYRIAFGHRRWAACARLGIAVRAVVAELSDEAMIVAQGQENAERRDLTFIERAGFAAELEGRGHSRRLIGEALACDKSEVSRLLSVCRSVPIDLVVAIGRAPGAGRPRWVALGRALAGEGAALDRALDAARAEGFARLPSDERFADVLTAAKGTTTERAPSRAILAAGPDGPEPLATLSTGRAPRLAIAPAYGTGFADWLAERLPDLAAEWRAGEGTGE